MGKLRPGKAERAAARAAAAEAAIIRSSGHTADTRPIYGPRSDLAKVITPPAPRRRISSGAVVKGGHYRIPAPVRATRSPRAVEYSGCVTKAEHGRGAIGARSLKALQI